MFTFINIACVTVALIFIITLISGLTGSGSIKIKIIYSIIRLVGIGMVLGLAVLCRMIFQ